MFLNRNVVATVALSLLLAIGQLLTPLAVGAELAAPSGEANYNDALDWASGSSGDSFAAGTDGALGSTVVIEADDGPAESGSTSDTSIPQLPNNSSGVNSTDASGGSISLGQDAVDAGNKNVPDDALGSTETGQNALENPNETPANEGISLSYEAHVAEVGWQGVVDNGEMAGTTGRGLALEALRFNLKGASADCLQIGVHVADIGWCDAVSSDSVAGTTGQSRALEAVNLTLSGDLGATYDIWYRVHAANFGWLGWASNGQNAGSEGYGNALEAIEVKLVEKGSFDPGEGNAPAFRDRADEPPSVTYRAHVSEIGWQPVVSDGRQAGTVGRSLPMEALEVSIDWYGHAGGVDVRAHVQDLGWQGWRAGTGGTTGASLPMEAVQLRLAGEVAETYDIWYRVHVADLGWLGWASNGEAAGTTGQSCAVQAIELRLLPKGTDAPGAVEGHYVGPLESVSGTASRVTGDASVTENADGVLIGGEDELPLSSFGLSIKNPLREGSICYNVCYQFTDWGAEWLADGQQTASPSDGRQIEGVRIALEGDLAQIYDIWYRVHTEQWGWSGWAANGYPAGSERAAQGIQALEVKLIAKGGTVPGLTDGAYQQASGDASIAYQAHSADIGWQPLVRDGETAGTTGRSKALEAVRVGLSGSVEGGVQIEAHVAEVGWRPAVSAGELAGTVGESLAIQAVKISLTGEAASQYDVVYRVHAAGYGWLGWAMNGAVAGTTGLSRDLEAIEIKLVDKGAFVPPENSAPAYIPAGAVFYQTKSSGLDWQEAVSSGALSGTTGQSRALTGVRIVYDNETLPGGVAYSVHVQDIGWMNDVYDGTEAGVTGLDKRIEAIKIRLTGLAEDYYDIWYRAYVEEYGWLGWTKNGSPAGSGSIGYRMEALEVVLSAKGAPAPGSTDRAYTEKPMRMNAVLLGVPAMGQNPELPTGCESVALTNVLNYYGFGLPKTVIADQYMPKSSWDFVTAFWGNPHSSYSGNCISAPGITNTANSFLVSRGSGLRAYDITDVSLEGMYTHLQNGNPVIVWSTMYQQNIGAQYAWQNYGGRRYFTVTNSHTVVLRGFDRSANVVYLADSLSGYVTMDASRFYLLYNLRGSQAVVVR